MLYKDWIWQLVGNICQTMFAISAVVMCFSFIVVFFGVIYMICDLD